MRRMHHVAWLRYCFGAPALRVMLPIFEFARNICTVVGFSELVWNGCMFMVVTLVLKFRERIFFLFSLE
jgi:hypothetical protein